MSLKPYFQLPVHNVLIFSSDIRHLIYIKDQASQDFKECLSVPVVAAVINPLSHDGVIGIQVNRDVFALRVEHIAKLLQSAVF